MGPPPDEVPPLAPPTESLVEYLRQRILQHIPGEELEQRLVPLRERNPLVHEGLLLLQVLNDLIYQGEIPVGPESRHMAVPQRGRTMLRGMLAAVWTARSAQPPYLLMTTAVIVTPEEGPVIIRAMNERTPEGEGPPLRVDNGRVWDGLRLGTEVRVEGLSWVRQRDTSNRGLYFVDRRRCVVTRTTLSSEERRQIVEWMSRIVDDPVHNYVTIVGVLREIQETTARRCIKCERTVRRGETRCPDCGGGIRTSKYFRVQVTLPDGRMLPCTLGEKLAKRLPVIGTRVWLSGMVATRTDGQRVLRVRSVNNAEEPFDYESSLERALGGPDA